MPYKYVTEVGEARPAAGDVPSASAVFRNISSKDGFPTSEASTLYELFDRSTKKFADSKCLGFRPKKGDTVGPYEYYTYAETAAKVADVASGLHSLGVAAQSRVGVFGTNCPEWMIAMQACNRMSYHCVPLYDSLGENAIEYIVNHSESVVAFTSTEKLPNLVKALPKCTGTLKNVVYWGAGNADAVKAATDLGFTVVSFDELMAKGKAAPAEPVPPKPEDLCTIMYTSGTTGDPKGVLLKHSALVAAVVSTKKFLDMNDLPFGPEDSYLSYLPLAHIFDRHTEELFLSFGGCIGFWQGDVLKLVDDAAAFQPTMFCGVPRVYDRIYGRVMGGVKEAGGLKKVLFEWGYNRKLHYMKLGKKQVEASPFFDKLVFSKVKARLGGRVRILVSGGAPLAPHVEEFLKVAFCCPVVQGYGLTETAASSVIAMSDDWAYHATVGVPTPCTELRFESVPDMNYDALSAEGPRGEILLRGPPTFTGYYKNEKGTTEVLEKDGWFHTGDIGIMTPEGAVKIVDRKKNIFKLAQGEYIAVEKLEASYKKNLDVEQVWVYGNSFKSCLLAVVVPTVAAAEKWAAANGVKGTYAEICANEAYSAALLKDLQATGKADKLKGFEMIKGIIMESEQFSVENELLTPSFKLKRPQLQKKYQAQIDALYAKIDA